MSEQYFEYEHLSPDAVTSTRSNAEVSLDVRDEVNAIFNKSALIGTPATASQAVSETVKITQELLTPKQVGEAVMGLRHGALARANGES